MSLFLWFYVCFYDNIFAIEILFEMTRPARYLPEQGTFHVLARGNNRTPIFHRTADYLAYLGLLSKIQQDSPVQLHHYCLMPNHIHLLVSAGPPASALSGLMHRLQLSYAVYYKAHYGYTGHLWEGRFKALRIDSEKYFFVCAAYIELNPVAAGLAEKPEQYPFSSYARYALGKSNDCLEAHPLYEQLGLTPEDQQEAFKAIVQARTITRAEDQQIVSFPAGMPGRPKNRDITGNVPISSGR